jgi:hypothetical protein
LALSPRLGPKIPNTSRQSPGRKSRRSAIWSMPKVDVGLARSQRQHQHERHGQATQHTKAGTRADDVTDTSHFMRTFNRSVGAIQIRGQTMTTFHRRPQFQAPIYKLPSARAAEREDDEMPTENLSELLGQVSKNSTGEIDSLIGEFGRLRGTLQTDGERIKRGLRSTRH